jgi:glutamate/tyrosine decarboxylase-like PLP-dependent enzyme
VSVMDDAQAGIASSDAELPPLLQRTVQHAAQYLTSLPNRQVHTSISPRQMRQRLPESLGEHGADPGRVIDELAVAVEPGLVASTGGRYHGYVVGGTLPVALAADWLTSTWDQNACFYAASPAAAAVEEVVGRWVAELLGLPTTASFGVTTGAQAANTIGLAAGRHAVLQRAGWDVHRDGLHGAPAVTVFAGAGRHSTIDRAARLLGLGQRHVRPIAMDDQGAMRPAALQEALNAHRGPAVICAQAGNVNTGAVDPLAAIVAIGRAHDAWVHVDGAFGLWAAASPARAHLVDGVGDADSWSVDGHKWLNVPYDAAFVFVADPDAHRAVTSATASYAPASAGRDPSEWVLEFSRRARAFPIYAALRQLGRDGVARLVEQCCGQATWLADRLRSVPGVEVLNEVRLNQVLWRMRTGEGGTRAVLEAVQSSGVTWMGPTTWGGESAIRLSVSGWATTANDLERTLHTVGLAVEGLSHP